MMRALALLALLAAPARAATTCAQPYGSAAIAAGLVCTQWVSRFDGTIDHAYVRLPATYDARRPTDVIMWFHGAGAPESTVGDYSMHTNIGDSYRAITVTFWQRGGADYLGDSTQAPVPPLVSRNASKYDLQEFIDQLGAKFNIRHVTAYGVSMGGFVALRVAQLYPSQIDMVLVSAPALCFGGSDTTTCAGALNTDASLAIFDAARAGVYDGKLFYYLIGASDPTVELLPAARAFNAIMLGETQFHYAEIAGQGHRDFFDYYYNQATGFGGNWLVDNTTSVPRLREDIDDWRAMHSWRLDPHIFWIAPKTEDQWYLTPELRAKGGRTPWLW